MAWYLHQAWPFPPSAALRHVAASVTIRANLSTFFSSALCRSGRNSFFFLCLCPTKDSVPSASAPPSLGAHQIKTGLPGCIPWSRRRSTPLSAVRLDGGRPEISAASLGVSHTHSALKFVQPGWADGPDNVGFVRTRLGLEWILRCWVGKTGGPHLFVGTPAAELHPHSFHTVASHPCFIEKKLVAVLACMFLAFLGLVSWTCSSLYPIPPCFWLVTTKIYTFWMDVRLLDDGGWD